MWIQKCGLWIVDQDVPKCGSRNEMWIVDQDIPTMNVQFARYKYIVVFLATSI